MSKIRQYKQLPVEERLMFLEALWISLKARFLIMFSSLNHYGYKLGEYREESPEDIDPFEDKTGYKIKHAVRRIAKNVPWRCNCMEQAIIAKKMLNHRNIKSTLYLGVMKNEQDMLAHAWVRCGNRIITGKEGHKKFTIVSSFA